MSGYGDNITFIKKAIKKYNTEEIQLIVDTIIKIELVRKKNEKRKNMILKVMNQILRNAERDEIDNVIDFKNVEREVVLDKKNKKYFDKKILNDVLSLFSKNEINYQSRESGKYLPVFLRRAIVAVGHQFKSSHKCIYDNGKKINKTFYTII